METWGCERSGENRHAKIATTPKISDVNHADRDMTMDCRTEEYFKGVLQKFVPIVDFEPSVKTVEATEKFESFVTKMKDDENREKLVMAAWKHTSGSDPRIYQGGVKNGIEWKIRKALENNGLPVDEWFVEICDNEKEFPGTEPKLKWKTEGTDKFFTGEGKMTETQWEEASGLVSGGKEEDEAQVVKNIGLWRFILGRDLTSTKCAKDEEAKNLVLVHAGLGELAYAMFQLLVRGIPDEVKRNVWYSMNEKTLREVWLGEDEVAPTRFWYEAAALFTRVFLRMFLVLGVEHTRTVFTIMGTQYDIDNEGKKDQNKSFLFTETLVGRSNTVHGKWIRGSKLEKPTGTYNRLVASF